MAPSEPDPSAAFDLVDDFADELAGERADERIYRIALQLYEPARIAAIADRADCAPDTARRHLRRLADIGVVERVSVEPATYRRNESYFEWRERSRLERLSPGERRERLETLTERERTFRERYDAEGPEAVDALAHASHADLEEVWDDLAEWSTVRRRLERLEAVRQQQAGTAGSESA